jgi:hypothetical protein
MRSTRSNTLNPISFSRACSNRKAYTPHPCAWLNIGARKLRVTLRVGFDHSQQHGIASDDLRNLPGVVSIRTEIDYTPEWTK